MITRAPKIQAKRQVQRDLPGRDVQRELPARENQARRDAIFQQTWLPALAGTSPRAAAVVGPTKVVHRAADCFYEPFAAVGAVAVLLALVAMLFWATPAMADTIKLRPEAFVKGPSIVLGDIADVEGEQSATISAIDLGSAAQPGSSKRFNATMLASRLRNAGVDPAVVQISGALTANAVTMSNQLARGTMVESLRDYILANMPWKPENAEIDIPEPFDDVVVPDGNMAIEWHMNPQYHFVGSGGFRADIKVDGKTIRSVMMRANINAYEEVLVAKSEVQRGKPAREQDFELRKNLLLNGSSEFIKDSAQLEGLIAKKSLFPGQVIKPSDFEAPIAIKRGQVISVETRAGGLLIQSQAVALADARIGDLVQCNNPSSSQTFQGLVREDGAVILP